MARKSIITSGLLLLLTALPVQADSVFPPGNSSDGNADILQKISSYIYRLGVYLGFDLEKSVSPTDTSNQLTDSSFTQVVETYFINTFFGAITVNTMAAAANQNAYFIPTQQNSMYSALATLNSFANATFAKPPYNEDGSFSGGVSVNAAIDQQPYQNDPVSQSLLNILATPSPTYCMNYDGTDWQPDSKTCPPLTQNAVTQNVVGKDSLPTSNDYLGQQYILSFLPQLNSDSLLAPLMYDTNANQNDTSSSQNKEPGLTALNGAQLAANYIRYATNSVTPIALPKKKEYDSLYLLATDNSDKFTSLQKEKARETLNNYLASIRSFTAQMSVAYSNLYYILSKRLPQTTTTGSDKPTSQALNEFVMATWRLNNPTQGDKNSPWLQKINNGSSATVQKEIAILLAEINYQLYLNRQQDERILLTNTISLIKSAHATPPQADLANQAAGSPGGS